MTQVLYALSEARACVKLELELSAGILRRRTARSGSRQRRVLLNYKTFEKVGYL